MGNPTSTSTGLRVLLIEDSEPDALLMAAELRRHGYELQTLRVQDEAGLAAALQNQTWEAVISDYSIPGFRAMKALEMLQEKGIDIPFIIVSGTIGEETAVEAMKAGAHDYIMKDRLSRLAPALERELREAAGRKERRRVTEESQFQARLLNTVGQAVIATDLHGKVTFWNRYAEILYGWPAAEALGRDLIELTCPDGSRQQAAEILRRLKAGQAWFGESVILRRDGATLTALITETPIYDAKQQMIGIIGIATDVTERKRAESELKSSREQFRALAVRLESIREEERKMIARDMHDDLGQALTALRIDLAWLKTRLGSAKTAGRHALLTKIRAMGKLIDQTADEVRDLCARLRPGVLDDLGLVAAIRWQAQEFAKRNGLQCELKLPSDELKLDPRLSLTVFRIFQEILNNVARHAEAKRIAVSLDVGAREVSLKAADDGRGIRPGELTDPKSLGLVGMRERALALGGIIEFQGSPKRGTEVSLRIPLG